jgi:hypothetical protein
MSTRNDQPAGLLSEHEIEQHMTALRAALTRMDADPKEAARIQDLADKTDAQMIGHAGPTDAEHPYPSPPASLAALIQRMQDDQLETMSQLPPETAHRTVYNFAGEIDAGLREREETGRLKAEARIRLSEAEHHSALLVQRAEFHAEMQRRNADIDIRQAMLDAETCRRAAELDARQIRLDARERQAEEPADATSGSDRGTASGRLQHSWRALTPVVAVAVAAAALAGGLFRGQVSSLVPIVLASAAAAYSFAYSLAILISTLRLTFRPNPGAAIALWMLLGGTPPRATESMVAAFETRPGRGEGRNSGSTEDRAEYRSERRFNFGAVIQAIAIAAAVAGLVIVALHK